MDTSQPCIHLLASLINAAPEHAQQGVAPQVAVSLINMARSPGGTKALLVAPLAPRQAATEFKSLHAPASVDLVSLVIIHPMGVIVGVASVESVKSGGVLDHEGGEYHNRDDGASRGPYQYVS